MQKALAEIALLALKALLPHCPPGLVKKIESVCDDIKAHFGGGGGP